MTVENYTSSALSDLVKEFLQQYKDSNNNFKYVEMIDSAIGKTSITISTKDILLSELEESTKIYELLMKEPLKFIEATERAVKEIYNEKTHDNKNLEIHIDEVERRPSLVDVLGNKYINDIITINGMVVSKTSIYNITEKLVYKCPDGHITTITNSTNLIPKPPSKCSNAKCTQRRLEEILQKEFIQQHRAVYIKSEEEFSFQNDEIEADLMGDLIDVIEAGDRVQITGIIQSRTKKNVYINYIRCLNIKKLDDVDLTILPEDEELFKQFPHEPDFLRKFVLSISPSTLGYETVKESLLLQRIASPDKINDDGTMVRGWFNIGLFGSGGVAKTKFGEWEVANLPRTQIVGSKGASGKGLLLGLEEDSSGRKTLRAGAFINCREGGVVVLDEFPKLPPEVVDELFTTLEGGYASISKVGHQAKVKANAGLLATGNAYNEEWNENLNLKDNLNLSVPLLQRFDYLWIMIDQYDEKQDSDIADAILNGVDYSKLEIIPHSSTTLAKYIKFVKRFKPMLSDDVKELLKSSYQEIRKSKEAKENGISPRHLNTLIRSTLAYARLNQRQYTTVEDAGKAVSLIKELFKQRNISISEADTYVNRQFNRCMQILHDSSANGLETHELFEQLLSIGSAEQIAETINDLGRNANWRENKKWREVVEKIKKSHRIKIVCFKPLSFTYKKNLDDIGSWN